MDTINSRLAGLRKPLDMSFGEVAIFGGRVVHGTEKNISGQKMANDTIGLFTSVAVAANGASAIAPMAAPRMGASR